MLTVKRYLNGTPIEPQDLKNITIDSSLIRHIIADVNNRLKFFNGQKNNAETVENYVIKKACGA